MNDSDAAISKTRSLYIDLLKRCLVNSIYPEYSIPSSVRLKRRVAQWAARQFGYELVSPVNMQLRITGNDWPLTAHTMIGSKRLNNIQFCVEETIKHNIPGDLMEAGVWRGGACILMRGILKAYDVQEKKVWVVDSFEGLPTPTLSADKGLVSTHKRDNSVLAISLEKVKENFVSYGLLDDQVCFLKGWFKDTLPNAPVGSLSVLRLDGDLFESTMDSLNSMYPKLSVGGYLIVDDYNAIPACKRAVDEYRSNQHIQDPIVAIDHTGVFWRRSTL
jgi:hypothetical protein